MRSMVIQGDIGPIETSKILAKQSSKVFSPIFHYFIYWLLKLKITRSLPPRLWGNLFPFHTTTKYFSLRLKLSKNDHFHSTDEVCLGFTWVLWNTYLSCHKSWEIFTILSELLWSLSLRMFLLYLRIILPELLLASTMPGLVTCAQSVWARCNLCVRRFGFDQYQEHLIFTPKIFWRDLK